MRNDNVWHPGRLRVLAAAVSHLIRSFSRFSFFALCVGQSY